MISSVRSLRRVRDVSSRYDFMCVEEFGYMVPSKRKSCFFNSSTVFMSHMSCLTWMCLIRQFDMKDNHWSQLVYCAIDRSGLLTGVVT